MITPLSVRIMDWRDVPPEWWHAIGVDVDRVMFVPDGRNVSAPQWEHVTVTAFGGTIYGWTHDAEDS